MGEETKPPPETLVETLNPAISKYVEIRNYIKRREAKLKAELKKYANARDKLSAYLSATLSQNKIKRIGGEAGTAFTSDMVRYKVVDGGAYLRWLIDNNMWETAKIEPIPKETDAVASARFDEWLEEREKMGLTADQPSNTKFEHFLPPGVTRTVTTVLKVRANGDDSDAD